MLDFTEYTKIFISLFAILDPIGIIPIIILFTAGMTASRRAHVGHLASLTVCAILLVALLIGQPLLAFFGISINSFRVAGGILLLLMAIKMIFTHPALARMTNPTARMFRRMRSCLYPRHCWLAPALSAR